MAGVKANINVLGKYMTQEQQEWWNDFLRDPVSFVVLECQWYLDQLEQYEEGLIEDELPSGNDSLSPLGVVMTKERQAPQVRLK